MWIVKDEWKSSNCLIEQNMSMQNRNQALTMSIH